MLGGYAGKWRSHPDGDSVGFQHQHSLSTQSEIGFADAADVGANAFSYNLQRRTLPGLGEVPVDRQFRLRIEAHALVSQESRNAGTFLSTDFKHPGSLQLSGSQESRNRIKSRKSFPGLKLRRCPTLHRCYLAALPSMSLIPFAPLKLARLPPSLAGYPRSFAFYLRNLISSIETRSAPAFARCFPRSFAFYLGNPFPRFLGS